MRNRGNMKNLKNFTTTKSTYNTSNNYSSFWLGDDWDNNGSLFDDEDVKPKTDLIALSSYRRAIANFVNIVTQKDIPVTFKSSGDSYTDGKKVVISSKLDDKLFDSSVGLALHEGSHIKLSNFDFLKGLEQSIPEEYFNRGEVKGYSKGDIKGHIKNLLNYVEDRRIDYYVFSSSPGYKGYYHSMYDKYFHSKIIDKALGTDEYTEESVDSYMFRIINLTNKNTDLTKLSGLKEIYTTIDFKNISRLDSTESSFNIACEIYHIILKNLPDASKTTDENGNESYESAEDSGNGGESVSPDSPISDEQFESLLESIENGEMGDSDESGNGVGVNVDGKGEKPSDTDTSNESQDLLSPQQKKQLENAIKKQNKFMDGEVTKKNVTKKEKKDLDTIESSGMSYVEVGEDAGYNKSKTKCIVVKNLTKKLCESDSIGMISKWKGDRYDSEDSYRRDTYIEDGIRLGTILGRKLQVRGESRETKWTRLDSGRIDKRLISELGFGNDRVFSTSFTESYSDAFLHISVDASGSMGGDKWTNTMKSVVAITKAIDMINNVDVVVSFRSTQSDGRGRSSSYKPIILIAYDSRVDNFIKVKNLFKYITYNGTTPEGLCYEAILNEIVPTTTDRDSYFLNYSDGMPMFGNDEIDYHGSTAVSHTKKMVKEIRSRGIKVMSYFVGSGYGEDRYMGDFKKMYGKDSEFVDITSVMSISKTMNKKFLEKN
jgi:hypothetical protein|tara:strand:+ start:1634 stop:3778 length:2145 start_codon:yes stop_codon:yes gene_type:complete